MDRRPGTFGLWAALALLALAIGIARPAGAATGSDASKPAGGGMPSMSPEEMQKMMAYAVPGENHKALGKLVGNWKTTVRLWMGPGDPAVSQGTATYAWALGGRYLQCHQTGSFNGMPYEGMGIDGYDNGKKQYFNVWFDNMGTGLMYSTGQPAADGQGIEYTGTTFDPSQMKDMTVREIVHWNDANHYVYTMYSSFPGPDGKPQEMKVLEILGEKQPG